MLRGQFSSQLSQFIHSQRTYEVVYSSSPISSNLRKVLILDSSFNPPHLGHYSLVKKSFHYKYHDHSLAIDSTSVLLLLSVKNADKLVPQPAPFEDRLDMMKLLADFITKELNIPVSVALTKHAKFVDKSNDIQKWLSDGIAAAKTDLKLTFLVGFDTLIRIFDQKYYVPQSLEKALSDFMVNNELFCLTRSDDKEYSLEGQLKYIENIRTGKLDGVPIQWRDSIFLDEGDDSSRAISSSSIRKEIIKNDWHHQVITEIKDYILRNGVYKL